MDQILPVVTSKPEAYPLDDDEPENVVPPMPSHWIFKRDERWVAYFIFRIFCSISLGHTDLETLWEKCNRNCPRKTWEDERDLWVERQGQTNLVVRFRRIIDEYVVCFDCDG